MGDICYRPLIEDMTFSYSRIKSYETCPYGWKLNYLDGYSKEDKFYSSYGKLIHSILEKRLSNKITKKEMTVEFLTRFSTEVFGARPSAKIVESYINSGLEYLRSFEGLGIDIVDVEKCVNFSIDNIKMVGVIDVVGKKCDSGKYIIVDHKSHDLKPRSMRKKPTKRDEELDEYLRQLYLYSTAIKNEYGEFPEELWFNCYRSGTLIKEKFREEAYKEAVRWALNTIEIAKDDTDFLPTGKNYFYCRYICDQSSNCDEYLEELDM